MGVYIKGLEMPKNCMLCPFHLLWPLDDEVQCLANRWLWCDGQKRHDDCPLIGIPPHGRLIDADALHKLFIEKGEKFKGVGGAMVAVAALCIATAPTIIPAEPSKERREYEAQVEAAQYCEMYEPTYDPETGAM